MHVGDEEGWWRFATVRRDEGGPYFPLLYGKINPKSPILRVEVSDLGEEPLPWAIIVPRCFSSVDPSTSLPALHPTAQHFSLPTLLLKEKSSPNLLRCLKLGVLKQARAHCEWQHYLFSSHMKSWFSLSPSSTTLALH